MINAVDFYRMARFLYLKNIPLLPWIIDKVIFYMYNSVVPHTCEIGKATFLACGGVGVLIHPRTVIGQNVNIGSNVTIGGRSGKKNVPIVGNNVFIATGSKILGDLKIGDNAVVVGVPAYIIKYRKDTSKRYGEV